MNKPKVEDVKKLDQDCSKNDFNEEQMETSPVGTPVETDPEKPNDKQPPHIPGVAAS